MKSMKQNITIASLLQWENYGIWYRNFVVLYTRQHIFFWQPLQLSNCFRFLPVKEKKKITLVLWCLLQQQRMERALLKKQTVTSTDVKQYNSKPQ